MSAPTKWVNGSSAGRRVQKGECVNGGRRPRTGRDRHRTRPDRSAGSKQDREGHRPINEGYGRGGHGQEFELVPVRLRA